MRSVILFLIEAKCRCPGIVLFLQEDVSLWSFLCSMHFLMCFLDIDRILGMGIDPCFKHCRSTWGVGFMNCLLKITVCEPMHYPVVVLIELTLVGKLMGLPCF